MDKRDVLRITPWGEMTYFDYKKKIEFSKKEYDEIDNYCKSLGIDWTASAWDIDSIDFINNYNVPFIKVPSDKCSDLKFINYLKKIKIPILISTGGTDLEKISEILEVLKNNKIALMQCTSIYPCPTEKVNLKMINKLKTLFN